MTRLTMRSWWFFFRYNLIKPGSKRYYEALMRNQILPPDQIEQISWDNTRRLLQYAYEHVTYYKPRFNSIGLRPEDITKPEHFTQVPLLRRDDLTEHFQSLLSNEVSLSDVRISSTGGSTGEPVKVYLPKKSPRAALGWRMFNWWGLSPECDWASTYRDYRPSMKSKIINWIATWPTKEILLNASAFGAQDIERFVVKFNHVKPPMFLLFLPLVRTGVSLLRRQWPVGCL